MSATASSMPLELMLGLAAASMNARRQQSRVGKRTGKLRAAKPKNLLLQVRKYRHAYDDAARDAENDYCDDSKRPCREHHMAVVAYADKCEALIKQLDAKKTRAGVVGAYDTALDGFLLALPTDAARRPCKYLQQAMARYYGARVTAVETPDP